MEIKGKDTKIYVLEYFPEFSLKNPNSFKPNFDCRLEIFCNIFIQIAQWLALDAANFKIIAVGFDTI